jgi:hypothetical protein
VRTQSKRQRKAFDFPILPNGSCLSVSRRHSVSAGRTALAWEDIVVTAVEYRAMALQHHRWAGMCRLPQSREEHFRLEKELLALADGEERMHGMRTPEQASNPQMSKGGAVKHVATGEPARPWL